MLEETPHVLNTTPETLAILLNAPRFREKLRTVEYVVVVDEIHALAGNKRGTHLSASLERLTEIADDSPTRIGCSATVEPLDESPTSSSAAPTSSAARVAGEVGDPDGFAPATARSWTPGSAASSICNSERRRPTSSTHLIRSSPTGSTTRLHGLIEDHENTLVFANSRSGAERTLRELRERFGYDESDSGCHHGSSARPSVLGSRRG